MFRMTMAVLASLTGVLVFTPLSGSAQHRPDFSGQWTLVEALVTSEGSTSPNAPATGTARRTSVNTISGAAFNCGRECRIVQEARTLTVDDARLATDYKEYDPSQQTPAVSFTLDGREAAVVDSFNSHRTIMAAATWDGDRLRIESRSDGSSIVRTQTLSLDGAQLVVVSATSLDGEPRSEVTFRYERKK